MRMMLSWLMLVMVMGVLAIPALAQQPESRPVGAPQFTAPPVNPPCPVVPPRSGGPRCFFRCLFVWLAVIHVLLAFWVYSDIRKRGEGHGIFIILALLGGIPATVVYALVRIGDRKL